MQKGKVFLVGAGPGDPGLLTVRGSECLRKAGVVVYDHSVNRMILSLAPETAELIDAGGPGGRMLSQRQINRLLVREARQGKTVVRLTGGDAVLSGRGAEEALELARHRIAFEIVPGVSPAVAVPAAAGILLAHPSLASMVAVAAGPEAPGRDAPETARGKPPHEHSAVVVLTGPSGLRAACRRLGRPEMPAAVIGNGTLPSQRVVTGALSTIAGRVEREGIRLPAVLVAGNAVRLRERLLPYLHLPFLPLTGKHILVTRPIPSGVGLASLLRGLGATVTLFPLLRAEAGIYAPARTACRTRMAGSRVRLRALLSSSPVDAVTVTSSLCAHSLARLLDERERSRLAVAAIGPAPAATARSLGMHVPVVAGEYSSEGLAAALCSYYVAQRRFTGMP